MRAQALDRPKEDDGMVGYRDQVRKAYRQLGRCGGTFDYRDVLRELGGRPYAPTIWQAIRALQHDEQLQVVEPGTRHRPTAYRLKWIDLRGQIQGHARSP